VKISVFIHLQQEINIPIFDVLYFSLQCFDTVDWAAGRASGLLKKWRDGGGGHWLVRMEWRRAWWSVCLPLLIFPCTIKVQKFSSGTGSPRWS